MLMTNDINDVSPNNALLDLGGEIRHYHGLNTLKEIFERQASLTPKRVALEDATGTQSLTYEALDALSESLSHVLRSRADVVGPGKRVGLAVAERNVETMIGLLAILKTGAAYVPLGARLPDARLQTMIDDISPTVILCGDETCADRFKDLDGKLDIHVVRQADLSCCHEFPTPSLSPKPPCGDDLAYIIFTSGTSGLPKGVMVRNSAVARYIDAMRQLLQPTGAERVIQIMTLTFDSSIFDIWMAWAFGGTAVLCDQWTALEGLDEFIRARKITCLGCTPTQLSLIRPEDVPDLKIAAIGGEAVPPPLIEKWSRHPSCRIYNQYGPTEATCTVTSIQCTPGMRSPKSIGFANPGSVKLYILAHGDPVDFLVPGELCIAGPQVASGYFNRPDLTAQKFVVNKFSSSADTAVLYKTGDLCRWLTDGTVEYLGRIDSQVKLRGFRIELGDVESKVLERTDILACAVALRHRKGPEGAPFLCVYLVAEKDIAVVDVPGLRSHLVSSLPDHMIPAAFVPVESIPVDSNGKTDRNQLPVPQSQHFWVSHTFPVSSRNRQAQSLLLDEVSQLFASLLSLPVEDIEQESDFFRLGGHSILAARLLAQLRQRFSVRVRFTDFFVEPTVGNLVSRLTGVEVSNVADIGIQPHNHKSGKLVPLASAQSRMYYLHQLDPESSAYNMSAVYDLSGDVDSSRLQDAFRVVVRRHDILRTSYRHNSNGLYQTVHKCEFPLQQLDLGRCEGKVLLQRADEAINASCSAPFTIAYQNSFPLRALLVRLGQKHSRLAITGHHIAMDGFSWDILCSEVSAAYAGVSLTDLPIQFGDFCEWEAKFRQSRAYQEQLTYWRNQLGENPAVLRLPTDRALPLTTRTGGGESLTACFNGLAVPLRSAAATHGTTPFCILLSAYFVFLYRLTSQTELIVGILSSGRSQPDTSPLIGMFVNTLPVKVEIVQDLPFDEVVKRVKQAITMAFDNQDIAFEDLVKQLVHSRHRRESPLVQTMLTMDSYDESDSTDLVLDGLEVAELQVGQTATTMFDFSIGCNLGSEGDLLVEAEFATDLFDQSTVERMVKEFESILRDAFMAQCFSTDRNEKRLSCSSPSKINSVPVASPPMHPVNFLEPQTTEQMRLERIFCHVLDLPRVDIRDSFFTLGGDSLLSLQVVALARSIGYHINASHILELETVENIAELLLSPSFLDERSAVAPPEKEANCGPVELNPIQRWFFYENFEAPNHYNQSRMFLLRHDVDAQSIEIALLELIRHHDALRLCFKGTVENAFQNQHSKESASKFLSFRTVDASKEMLEGPWTAIEKETLQDQTSLHVENGPIVAATFFDVPSPDPPILYIVIHHLVVDETSWSVIADDLNLAYSQLIGGQSVALPPKSHSWRQWISALQHYSTSSTLMKEIEYWRHTESSSFKLPVRTEARGQATTEFSEDEISTSVHVSKTDALTSSAAVRDLLLASLAFSLAQLSAIPGDVCILVEGHGREEKVAGSGFDLSRTVGWFTSVFPVRFDFSEATTAESALLCALNCLRKVPNNGIGYGLLKFPFSGPSPLSDLHGSQITFNYLGRSGRTNEIKPFRNSTDLIVCEKDDIPCGSDWDPRNQSNDSILDISCYFLGESLEMTWRFRSNLLSRRYVQNLSDLFDTNIVSMVEAELRHGGLQFDSLQLSSFQAKFDNTVSSVWEKHQCHDSFHGFAMSAVVSGKVFTTSGYGFRDASRTVRADSRTRFSLGSLGKPFVSLLGAVLVDEGIIDLDVSLAATLSAANLSLPSVYGRMTLRQLFSMTAGVPYVETQMEETIDDPFEICRQIRIEHEPGTRFLYSNFSYALGGYFLALGVGVKDGLTEFEDLAPLFLQLLQERVFAPIGMSDARPEGYQLLCKNGLKVDSDHTRNAAGSAAMLPAGPVKASVTDAAHFLITEFQRGLSPLGRRVASESRVSERFDVSRSLGYDWGMGWFRDRTHGFLHMSGQWADSVGGFKLDPVTGFGISYLLSVRDSSHLQFLEMDMDRLFISMIGELERSRLTVFE